MLKLKIALASFVFATASPAFACKSTSSEAYILTEKAPAKTPAGMIVLKVNLLDPSNAEGAMEEGKGVMATVLHSTRKSYRGKQVRILGPQDGWTSCSRIGVKTGYVVGEVQPKVDGQMVVKALLRR
jgi:hypothetical protein